MGSIGNMYASSSRLAPNAIHILAFCLLLFLYGAILFSIFGLGATIENWGFTLNQRSVYSIAPGIVVLLLVALQGTTLTAESCINIVFGIFKFSAEEFYFRALLIGILLKLFAQTKYRGWWAVIGSSVVFTIPHLFLKEWSLSFALANGFGGGLLLGFVFYQTGSIFFPIVAHVSFNTAREGGALGGMLFAIFYFALVLGKRALVKRKSKTVSSSIQVPGR
jgi:membrane protease YdiL (CAAX protease family)